MSPAERRDHARVETEIRCRVRADGGAPWEGSLRSLSVSGALLVLSQQATRLENAVDVEFDAPGAALVSLHATVTWRMAVKDETQYGLQFENLNLKTRDLLARTLDGLIAASGTRKRKSPRLYRRLEVSYRMAEQFRATLDNISRGGLGLECEHPLPLGKHVEVRVSLPDAGPVDLPAEVVHCRRVDRKLHRVGLKFLELPPEKNEALARVLKAFAGTLPRAP